MKLLNFKTNKYLFFLILITLLFISFIFFIFSNLNKNKQLLTKLENSLILTKNILEEQKKYALSLAILLSKDKEIIQSFKENNRKKSFELVNRKIKTLKHLQNSNFEVQIHNKNLTTYLRSWDISIKDVPLASFRQGLVEVKKTQEPLVSIELGKRLNIKAISPLLENDTYLGSLEVIIGFKQLTKKLKKEGFSVFVLLNNKYLNIASDLKNHIKIHNYTLVNQGEQNLNIFKKVNLNNLKDYGYFTNKDLSFSYFSLYSYKREKLAYVIISSRNDSSIEITNNYEKKVSKKINGIIIE